MTRRAVSRSVAGSSAADDPLDEIVRATTSPLIEVTVANPGMASVLAGPSPGPRVETGRAALEQHLADRLGDVVRAAAPSADPGIVVPVVTGMFKGLLPAWWRRMPTRGSEPSTSSCASLSAYLRDVTDGS